MASGEDNDGPSTSAGSSGSGSGTSYAGGSDTDYAGDPGTSCWCRNRSDVVIGAGAVSRQERVPGTGNAFGAAVPCCRSGAEASCGIFAAATAATKKEQDQCRRCRHRHRHCRGTRSNIRMKCSINI